MKYDIDGQTKTKQLTRFLDAYGFVYMKEMQEDGGYSSKKTIVENVKTYQGEKVLTKTSRPYFSDTDNDIDWDETIYDQFGRKEKVIGPDGSSVRFVYGLNEVRKYTLHEDESESEVRYVFDNRSRLINTYDQLEQLTTYHYNHSGRLSQVDLPAKDNQIVQSIYIEYDSFGRRISIDDPSMGIVKFKYDANGNLVEQTDELGRRKTVTYDGFNRPLIKKVSDGTNDIFQATYHYDSLEIGNTASNFPIGNLTKIEDDSGTHLFAYDKLGNVSTKSRNINGLGTAFSEKFIFNEFGSLLQYTYPDGSVQKITYDGIGNHQDVTLYSSDNGILASASFNDYNAAQQMQQKSLGNSVKSSYTYTANGKLQHLQTNSTDGDPTTIQNLGYEFYKDGMVKNIADNRPGSLIKDGFNTDATQHFVYDKIGRLSMAFWGPEKDPSEIIEYAYSSIGNLKRRTSTVNGTETSIVDYEYNGQQVKAGFNSIAHKQENLVFSAKYDAYGNMTQKVSQDASGNKTTWDYVYDGENRLVDIYKNAVGGLSGNTPLTRFTYDHSGQRVKKLYNKADGSTITTWYISPTYEIREISSGSMTSTKYLALEGKGKISSVTATYNPTQTALFSSQRYYQFAGLISSSSFDAMVDKAYLYFMAFITHPESGKVVRNSIQLAFILVFLILVWLSWRIREDQRNSSFKVWQRLTALPIVLMFFLVSCQSGNQATNQTLSQGEFNYIGDNGEIETGGRFGTLDVNGTTADGIPIGVYYYHTDHLGSSTVITNKDGVEIARFAYNPFGELVQKRSWGENVVTHKFTSQEMDEETGLMYYNSRFYDPSISRFITADILVPKMDNAQSYNRYAYVINNPIQYTDPTGHSWLSDVIDDAVDTVHDTVDKIVHEVSTAATEAYHTTQYNFVHCVPLRIAGQVVATYYGGAWGAAAYAAWIAKSAGASDQQALKAAVISGVTSYVGSKVNGAIDGMDNGFTKVFARGLASGMNAKALGGSFEKGFMLGSAGELASWGIAEYTNRGNPTLDPASKSAGPKNGADVADPNRNNIGFADRPDHIFGEGNLLSRTANKMPGMNSMAVFHDIWAGSTGMNTFNTVVSIIPAIGATYQALGYESMVYEDELRQNLY